MKQPFSILKEMLSSLSFKQENTIADDPMVDLLKFLDNTLDSAVLNARLPSGQNPLEQLVLIITDGRLNEKLDTGRQSCCRLHCVQLETGHQSCCRLHNSFLWHFLNLDGRAAGIEDNAEVLEKQLDMCFSHFLSLFELLKIITGSLNSQS